jgi:hypothetical protein
MKSALEFLTLIGPLSQTTDAMCPGKRSYGRVSQPAHRRRGAYPFLSNSANAGSTQRLMDSR